MITINMYEDDEPAIEEIGYALNKTCKNCCYGKSYSISCTCSNNITLITILKWKSFL